MDRETDRWVRADEARAKLRELLDEVNGAHSFIYILRYDRPEAVLVPVEWFEAVKARLETGRNETDT